MPKIIIPVVSIRAAHGEMNTRKSAAVCCFFGMLKRKRKLEWTHQTMFAQRFCVRNGCKSKNAEKVYARLKQAKKRDNVDVLRSVLP